MYGYRCTELHPVLIRHVDIYLSSLDLQRMKITLLNHLLHKGTCIAFQQKNLDFSQQESSMVPVNANIGTGCGWADGQLSLSTPQSVSTSFWLWIPHPVPKMFPRALVLFFVEGIQRGRVQSCKPQTQQPQEMQPLCSKKNCDSGRARSQQLRVVCSCLLMCQELLTP